MLIPIRDLTSSRNTRPSSHTDQFTYHLRAVLPCLRSVRTRLSRLYPITGVHTSAQTKLLRAIKSTLFCSARRAFHTHGIPLRSLSEQARRSASSHSRCSGTAPNTSTIYVARHALHHRPRRSVPSLFFDRRLTNPPPSPSPTPADTGDFELSFTPRAGALEDVAVELYLGSGATGASSTGATGGGEWMYVLARRTLRWSLGSSASTTSGTARSVSAPGRTATLRGTFSSNDAHPRPARAAQISFALPAGALLSALKIDQLKLSGETYKPYKGMRGRALGRVEWRVEWKEG